MCCVPLVDDCRPQMPLNELPIPQLLPGNVVQNSFKADCTVLVSRIVSQYLPAFSPFKDTVVKHIPHMFSKEMENKSERVSKLNHIY